MLGIIHISDMHLEKEDDEILYLKDEYKKIFLENLSDVDRVLILITGDIAYRGIEEEYVLAEMFLNDFTEAIDCEVDIICVPGNHDCNFNPKLDNNKMRIHYINDFLNKTDRHNDIIFEDKLIKILSYKGVDKEKLFFVLINTAWISQLNEVPGKLYFPVEKYMKEIDKIDNGGIIITMFHHPSRWCHPDDSRIFDKEIESFSDFIFCGHEHSEDTFIKSGKYSKVIYFFGEALQKMEHVYKSGLQILKFNLSEKQYTIKKFRYINSTYNLIDEQEWKSYEEIVCKSNQLKLQDDTRKFINDLGMNLNHPKKENLILQDIFIYPDLDLKTIKKEQDKNINNYTNSSFILEEKLKNPIVIHGEQKYGKTALAKSLYYDFYTLQKTPLYIDLEKIKISKLYNLEKLIQNTFEKQYKTKGNEKFKELEKTIIIIDNIDNFNDDINKKLKLIDELYQYCESLICFSKKTLAIEEILVEDEVSKENIKVDEYEMIKLGHLLRYKLIEKWNTIGSPIAEYKDEFIIINENKLRVIDTIIGRNYVPSVPFYILVILQSTEMGNVHNLTDSSFGYYYQYLILQTLNNISNDTGVIDAINSFMIELSKNIKDNNKKSITEEHLRHLHSDFKDKLRISRASEIINDYDIFIQNLTKNNLIVEVGDEYIFCYKYIYYYYIARYYSNSLFKDDIREEIETMISKLYIEEYANIILFLVYMDRSSFIINKLLEVSNNLFNDVECVRLEGDTAFINELQDNILPKLKIDNSKKPIDERERKLKNQDEVERIYINEGEELEECNDNENFEIVRQLNFSFKSMEIAGQILKNYWGSLDGIEKEKIGVSLYSVGLRGLNKIYSLLKNTEKKLAKVICDEIIEEKELESVDINKLQNQAKKMIVTISTLFTYGTIIKIVECAGDRNLERTYEDIYSKLNFNSIRVINLIIKLQFPNGAFPYKEIEEILNDNENNQIATYLVKKSVVEYVYMYKLKRQTIEKISHLIKIPISNFRLMKLKESLNNKKD